MLHLFPITFRSTNRGNFVELLKWASPTDPLVNSIINDSNSNATYLSPTIQNEILSILADQIRQKIANEVSRVKTKLMTKTIKCHTLQMKDQPFVLMADDARDVSGKEQMSIVLRYVDSENEIQEHFMGFIKLDEFDAKSLAEKLFEFLNKWNIPADNCVAQCYDGYISFIHADISCKTSFNHLL